MCSFALLRGSENQSVSGVTTICLTSPSHRVDTDTDWFSDPPNNAKLHISGWPFIVASLRHTCAIFMLCNQHLDMPHLLGGMDYLGKGAVLTNTDLNRFVNNIWEKWIFCVPRKSFRSLSSAHEKWEQNKSVAFYVFISVFHPAKRNVGVSSAFSKPETGLICIYLS